MKHKKEVITLFGILVIATFLLIIYKPSIIGYVTMFKVSVPNSPPNLIANISDQTWSIDTANNDAFDLDDYLSDPNLDPVAYTVAGNSSITVEINSSTNMVSFSQPSGWTGTEHVTFSATDDDGETIESNKVSLTITTALAPSPAASTGRGTKSGSAVVGPAPTPPPRPPIPTGIKRETSYTTISSASFTFIKKPIFKKILNLMPIILIILIIISFIIYKKRISIIKKKRKLVKIIKNKMRDN